MGDHRLVSIRLKDAGNIRSAEAPRISALMFALADRAEAMEKLGVDPLRESNWGMVFAHAVVLADMAIALAHAHTEEKTDGLV